MLFYPTISVVASNLKYCRLQSCVLSSVIGHGQFVPTKSIHTPSLQKNDRCEVRKLSFGLLPGLVFTRSASRKKKNERPDPPTDFLPFPWERRQPFDQFENSGDKVKILDADPTLPKYDLELREDLKDLDDYVRKLFTLETGDKTDLREANKQLMLKKVQQHPMDFNSREVKIALQTIKVQSLFLHCQQIRKETRGKSMLYQAIHKRNKMLKELRQVDLPRFQWILQELNIEYTAPDLGVEDEPYTREGELRRLTKEYSEKLVSEKRAAYRAELKEQQKLFLKEKEEILAWIAKEENELGISETDNSSVS